MPIGAIAVLGFVGTAIGAQVDIEIMTDNYPGETTWEVTDQADGTVYCSGGPYEEANTLFFESCEVPDGVCVNFTIYDSFGDGICCAWGDGYYRVFYNETLVCEGGEFATDETCWNLSGDPECLDGPPPCAECPEGGIPEGEPDGGCAEGYEDVYNAGCNSDPPTFNTPIQCGDTYCGGSGTFIGPDGGDFRDTDWFDFTLEGPTSVTWSATAEFPGLIFILDGVCPTTVIVSATADYCVPFEVSADLAAGDYFVWMGPSVFTGVGCGVEYVATLDCTITGACCLPDGSCIITDADDCAAQGGTYVGDYTDCGEFLYTWEECANPFEDISGSGTELVLGDDDGMVVPIGFSFSFFGNTYTDIAVTSNGYLTFGGDLTDYTNDPIPNTTDPNDIICPFWDDLTPPNGGTIHYQTLGAEPDRVFVAQWTDVPEFPDVGANTFEALLFEGSNCIEFRYGEFTAILVGDVTVGVENADGTQGTQVDESIIVPGTCIVLCGEQTENPCEGLEEELYLDIKPGSCPNSFNRGSNGKLPAALLGTMDFDVAMINPMTLMISRADGVGGSVAPLRFNYEDVGTPFMGDPCDCHEMEWDGYMDLTMKFKSSDVTEVLMLGEFMGGDQVPLVVTGELLDGTPFTSTDCIRIVPLGGPHGMANPGS
jgi:hypothetical protein